MRQEKLSTGEKISALRLKAVFLPCSGSYGGKLGQIIDISKGGLSFYHKNTKDSSETLSELDIIFDNKNQMPDQIPCKLNARIVYDFLLIGKNIVKFSSKKRCAVQFTDMTYYRNSWLDYFIQNHTADEAEEHASSDSHQK